VLQGLAAKLPPAADLGIGDLRLPLYDEDEDGNAAPDVVQAFRRAIGDSDGVVIATPEYNHGVPGVLKNALDWASRPYGQSVLIGKPVLAISISSAFTGGVRAQAQLRETLHAVEAAVVRGPQVVIGNIGTKVQDGRLVDEASLDFACSAIERLVAHCQSSR
jgi:chromate reductase